LDPEGGSQNATLVLVVVVLVVVVISSLKIPQGFLNTQRSATKLCTHIHADTAHRSTVSDFPLIFKLISNYQSSFRVIDLKVHTEPSLLYCRRSACSPASIAPACWQLQHDARWSVVMNIYARAAGGAYRMHILE